MTIMILYHFDITNTYTPKKHYILHLRFIQLKCNETKSTHNLDFLGGGCEDRVFVFIKERTFIYMQTKKLLCYAERLVVRLDKSKKSHEEVSISYLHF